MACLNKSRAIQGAYNIIKNINVRNKFLQVCNSNRIIVQNHPICTSTTRNDLMEFFDDKKNWGVTELKCGRGWKLEELRLKSNTDLHKLWYVLLKERNMLLTMEEECKNKLKVFPNPERLDKVEESMENLETVVRERNVAYCELETGETGERPRKTETNVFGLQYEHIMSEYTVPKHMNEEFLKAHPPYDPEDKDVKEFLLKYKEKEYLENRRKDKRDFNHVCGLLKRFPNMDLEAVKLHYPNVDIEKAKQNKRSRRHSVPK